MLRGRGSKLWAVKPADQIKNHHEVEENIRTCPVCGREFDCLPNWAYKLKFRAENIYYCRYTCMRQADEQHQQERKAANVAGGYKSWESRKKNLQAKEAK